MTRQTTYHRFSFLCIPTGVAVLLVLLISLLNAPLPAARAATITVGCTGGVGDVAALIQAINNANNEAAYPGSDTIDI